MPDAQPDGWRGTGNRWKWISLNWILKCLHKERNWCLLYSPKLANKFHFASTAVSSPAYASNEFDEFCDQQKWLACLKRLVKPFLLFDQDKEDLSFTKECEEYTERCAQLAAIEPAGWTLRRGKTIPGPANLYICQESRVLALQRDVLAFGNICLDVS